MLRALSVFVPVSLLLCAALPAQPNPMSWSAMPLPGGDRLEFRLHFPRGVTPNTPCPVALVFVDGKQGRNEVYNTLAGYFWMQVPKEKLGVILPVAPDGGNFGEGRLGGLSVLIHNLRGRTRPLGNGLHVIGIGEGVPGAMAAVRRWPEQFASLTLVLGEGEAPPDLPLEPRFDHLKLVVVGSAEEGAAPEPWAARIKAWNGRRDRGRHATYQTAGASEPESLWTALRSVVAVERSEPKAVTAIRDSMDRWHSAAARADAATYWGMWREDGVFEVPGSEEPWSLATLKERLAPSFAKAPGWILVPSHRDVQVAEDGDTATVAERIGTLAHGGGEGLARLVRTPEGWRVQSYRITGLPVDALPGADRGQ